jgi:hypothetical protein
MAKQQNNSKKARQKKLKTYREIFEAILSSEIPRGENIGKTAALVMENFQVKSINEAMAFAIALAAMNGDIKAFEIIRDVTGQKNAEKLTTDKVVIIDDVP